MNEDQLTELIRKYLSGEANEAEKEQVERWYTSFDDASLEMGEINKDMRASLLRSFKKIQERITRGRYENKPEVKVLEIGQKKQPKWYAVAVVALVLIAGSIFILHIRSSNQPMAETAASFLKKSNDFKPGGKKAVLTLGNGQKIILDSVNSGLLSMQGNTKVVKVGQGKLNYSKQLAAGSKQSKKVLYNTISTPRGGKYEIVLSDGSKVWMNAASSLKFPTVFTGKKRVVEMNGEAYFEIAKDADKPFIVKKADMEVQVLGTHFNVMAYENDANMEVSLLEGSVRVTENSKGLTGNGELLSPGEQVNIEQNGQMQLIKNANMNKVVAWKNNLFWFEDNNIQEVMKQLSRWYDVDINVEGQIPDQFTGSIPQTLTFSKVFEVLQKTGGIHYKIENGRTIIVTP